MLHHVGAVRRSAAAALDHVPLLHQLALVHQLPLLHQLTLVHYVTLLHHLYGVGRLRRLCGRQLQLDGLRSGGVVLGAVVLRGCCG